MSNTKRYMTASPSAAGTRIAIFHLGFFYSGGGEKLVLQEMRGLRARGYSVKCFAPYVDRVRCFPDIPEMQDVQPLLPAPPDWLPMKDPIWVAMASLFVPLLAWKFRSFDVFLGANQPGCWLAFVLSKILKKPYLAYLAHPIRILHPRVIDEKTEIRIREGDHRFIELITTIGGWFIDWADRASVRNARSVLTNGSYVSQWIKNVYGRDNLVCAAGCQPASPADLDYSQRWSGEVAVKGKRVAKPYILISNRHVPQKRFEYAIWALKMILREHGPCSLLVTGQETEYTQQLRYLAQGLGVADNVHFTGLVSEGDLERLYRHAAVYVYPSPEEDFGMGIIEAMASGTPVVAWGNGGPTGTVKDKITGFLIDPYDVDEFAEAIANLLTSPELSERMGRAGHARAEDLFTHERHCRILSRAILSVMRSPEIVEAELSQPLAGETFEPEEIRSTAWGEEPYSATLREVSRVKEHHMEG